MSRTKMRSPNWQGTEGETGLSKRSFSLKKASHIISPRPWPEVKRSTSSLGLRERDYLDKGRVGQALA